MAALCGRINGGNLMSKLLFREVRGSLQQHKHQRKEKVFKKIPGRLIFKLTSLVPRVLLDDGYVFLGFSKDGQFVISYSLQVDTDENTGFLPVYVYNLQWWWFIPYKPLEKISEVRLFDGKDGIEPDIFIGVCEWPADRSKILVYGHCAPRSRNEGTQCFITITAVPPLSPCKDCYIAETNFPCVKHKNKVMCLKHSFCIYCKFELAPPFPSFIPQIQLKMDGVVIFNTGDSLVALDFSINQPTTTTCDQTGNPTDKKPKRLFSCGTISPANSGSANDSINNHATVNRYSNSRGFPAGSNFSQAELDEESNWDQKHSKSSNAPMTSTSSSSSIATTNSNSTPSSINTSSGGNGNSSSSSSTNMTSSVSCQRTKFHPVNPSNTDQIEPQQQYLCCSTCCSEASATACCRHSKTSGHCRNCNCENSCPLATLNNSNSCTDCCEGGDETLVNLVSLKQQPSCCTVCDKTLTSAASSASCLHQHHHHYHHHHHGHHHVGTNFSPTPSSPTSCCDNNHANRLSDNNSRRCRVVKQRNGHCCCTCTTDAAKTDSASSLSLPTPPPPPPPPSAVFQPNTKLNVLEECQCPKRNSITPGVGIHQPKCLHSSVGDPDSKENMVDSTSQHPNNNNTNGLSDPYFFSPSNSSSGSTTTNSNENLPDYVHPNKSRSMSFSLKKFTYLTEETNVDSIFLNEEDFDFDLAYRSMLPLEVRGTDHKIMTATKTLTESHQPDYITVCQLMLDIEHFLEEVIHNVAEWGHRYIAFLNYDLQLLDVNAESGEVLAKVFALVQASKELNDQDDFKRSSRPKQYYQTSITFSWSLLTGNYETFHIEDLSEVDESDFLRKEWNPGNGEVTKLQQSLAIPQSFYSRVYTLTNEPVLKGHSLVTIVAPHHFVAISR